MKTITINFNPSNFLGALQGAGGGRKTNAEQGKIPHSAFLIVYVLKYMIYSPDAFDASLPFKPACGRLGGWGALKKIATAIAAIATPKKVNDVWYNTFCLIPVWQIRHTICPSFPTRGLIGNPL